MTDKRSKTHRQVWIPKELCDAAIQEPLPNHIKFIRRNYQWCVAYWLIRGLKTANKKTPPPIE